MKKKKNGVQQSIFRKELNLVPIEEYREMATTGKKKTAHERKFMNSTIKTAFALDLPCIHIEYFCGNKFYPTCSGTGSQKHKSIRAICPTCGKDVLAICVNRINKGLAGHFDILGVEWAIETKHKINKGEQEAKPEGSQIFKNILYDVVEIPHIIANEADDLKVYQFLRKIHEKKFPKRKR